MSHFDSLKKEFMHERQPMQCEKIIIRGFHRYLAHFCSLTYPVSLFCSSRKSEFTSFSLRNQTKQSTHVFPIQSANIVALRNMGRCILCKLTDNFQQNVLSFNRRFDQYKNSYTYDQPLQWKIDILTL